MHDIPLIRAFTFLSDITGEDSYRSAVDAYLDYFCEHCPNPVTGLFPWGEHAYWHHYYDKPVACGDSLVERRLVHDHLRQAPVWFWRMVGNRDSGIVVRFGEGLTGHLKDMESFDYSRHASIEEKKHSDGLFHFPRHGGFYLVDWAMAHKYSGEGKFFDWMDRMVQFHAGNRSTVNGLIKMDGLSESWGGQMVATLPQSVSLALAVYEVLEALDSDQALDSVRASSWKRFGEDVVDSALGVLAASDPHRTYCHYDFETGQGVDEQRILPLWYTSYGVQSLTEFAVMLMGLYRYTGREGLLSFSVRVIDALSEQGPPPTPRILRAGTTIAARFRPRTSVWRSTWRSKCGTRPKHRPTAHAQRNWRSGWKRRSPSRCSSTTGSLPPPGSTGTTHRWTRRESRTRWCGSTICGTAAGTGLRLTTSPGSEGDAEPVPRRRRGASG